MLNGKNKFDTQKMVLAALMTAFVIVFQLIGTFTSFFGPFSTALALIPIVMGAVMCGTWCGAWLGFVFAVVVFASGGASLFFYLDPPKTAIGAVIVVFAKGILCGLAAGLAYHTLNKLKANRYLSVLISALVCPVVNTAVFLLGSAIFYLDYAQNIVEKLPTVFPNGASGMEVFFILAFSNFLFEIGINIVLCPAMYRILCIKRKKA